MLQFRSNSSALTTPFSSKFHHICLSHLGIFFKTFGSSPHDLFFAKLTAFVRHKFINLSMESFRIEEGHMDVSKYPVQTKSNRITGHATPFSLFSY